MSSPVSRLIDRYKSRGDAYLPASDITTDTTSELYPELYPSLDNGSYAPLPFNHQIPFRCHRPVRCHRSHQPISCHRPISCHVEKNQNLIIE